MEPDSFPEVFIGNRLQKNCRKMALFLDNHFVLLYYSILPKKSRRCCLFGLDLHFYQFVIWEVSLIDCIVLFVFICNSEVPDKQSWGAGFPRAIFLVYTKKKLVETSRLFKCENLTNVFIVCKKNNLVSSFSFTQLFFKYSVKYLARLIYF